MSKELFLDGMGLGGFLLSMNTMLMLEKKGMLTPLEINEIIEHALLTLESYQYEAKLTDKITFVAARAILEQLRHTVSRP